MSFIRKLFFLFLFITKNFNANAQSVDSLQATLPKISGVEKINALLKVTERYYKRGQIDQAKLFCERAIALSKDEKDSTLLGESYYRMGGWIYNGTGDFSKAVEFLLKANPLLEKSTNKELLWGVTNALGNVYVGKKEYDKALAFYDKAYEIALGVSDTFLMSKTLIGKGNILLLQNRVDEALAVHLVALSGFDKRKNPYEYAMTETDIGIAYLTENKNEKALENFEDANFSMQKIDNKYGIGFTLQMIGHAYGAIGNHAMALNNYYKSLQVFNKSLDKYNVKECYKQISITYNKLNKYDSAYNYMQLYSDIKDSIYTEESSKQIADMQTKYETDKKEEENKSLITQNELSKTKIEQQKRLQLGLGLFLVTAFIFSFFLVRSNKQKQKQNKIISEQKLEVEQQRTELQLKNKEVTDSITYAKRIQRAILPPIKLISECFADGFIFYQPKDIVAGDFYWIEKKENWVLFAAADCTGHGVPGAMVSVVCNNALNRALREFDLIEPGELLDKTRELVIAQFEKSEEDVKDGMDISLCAVNTKTQELKWAGANNPLWLLKNNELLEIKADKQPIGKYINTSPFTTHTFQLHKNDSIYIFSDGYADQFGGAEEKKFKYKQLKELFLANAQLPMIEQRNVLESTMSKWMGNVEQIDDILVVGVRL